MSLHKNTQIQFRLSKQYKEIIKKHCDKADIDVSVYIMGLIKTDLDLKPNSKPLVHGVDWVLE